MTLYLAYRDVKLEDGTPTLSVLLGIFTTREKAQERIAGDDTPSRAEALKLLASQSSYRIEQRELDQ